MRALVLGVLVASLGCGGGDDDPATGDSGSDAADAGAPDSPAPDASTAITCDTPESCPCFSNDDCPETHACTSMDDSGLNVFCVEGPRGTGVAGDPCTGEASCASALCIEDDSGSFCSALCEDASTCPAELPRCLYIGFGVDKSICAPPAG